MGRIRINVQLRLSAIIALLFLYGCAATNSPVSSARDKVSYPTPPTFLMRGELVVGPSLQNLTPCGSNKQFWVTLSHDANKELIETGHPAYQPVYAELIGHLQPPSVNGPDKDFTARFVVDGINFISAENRSACDKPSRSTQAFGTEPFWNAKFEGNAISLSQLGAATASYPISSRHIDNNKREYHIDNGKLQLDKQGCSDGMSDSLYGWRAQLHIGESQLEGCATLPGLDPTLMWAGQYQAVSTKDATIEISLKLHPDHSASAVYRSDTKQTSIRESGFWQQLTPSQVQFVVTRYQDQAISATRLFTRRGNQLIATEELVNGKRYPIKDGGLQLYRVDD